MVLNLDEFAGSEVAVSVLGSLLGEYFVSEEYFSERELIFCRESKGVVRVFRVDCSWCPSTHVVMDRGDNLSEDRSDEYNIFPCVTSGKNVHCDEFEVGFSLSLNVPAVPKFHESVYDSLYGEVGMDHRVIIYDGPGSFNSNWVDGEKKNLLFAEESPVGFEGDFYEFSELCRIESILDDNYDCYKFDMSMIPLNGLHSNHLSLS